MSKYLEVADSVSKLKKVLAMKQKFNRKLAEFLNLEHLIESSEDPQSAFDMNRQRWSELFEELNKLLEDIGFAQEGVSKLGFSID